MGLKLSHKIKKENFRVCNVINHNWECLGEMAFLMFCSLQFLCSKWR